MSNPLFPRSAGILLHPTSLPGPFGIGDLGRGAHRFVDWLVEAGGSIWQVLPVVPPGAGFSPYATQSALAGSPWLIDLEDLRDLGLLEAWELRPPPFGLDRVDDEAMQRFKEPLLHRAADRLAAAGSTSLGTELATFRLAEDWVEEAALFTVLRRTQDRYWWHWPLELRDRKPKALARFTEEHRAEIEREVALQFFFDRQWRKLRVHCYARGVRLLGDIPIYVDQDSADVWSHRDQFLIDQAGKADPVAGVPPDYFSEVGQLWGNPLYDWARMKLDGYRWWIARLKRALTQVDLVRLDHFRGFSAYWAVPAGARDARPGRWIKGPGKPFFDALKAALGDLPLVAEDLGDIDAAVHELRDGVGLPGMRILQFGFGLGANHAFLPHNYTPHSVVYTGTHDNDTTQGWWQSTDEPVRDHVRRYLGVDGHDAVYDLIRLALSSVSHTAILPFQDVLALGSDARMNTPGEGKHNWRWRVRAEAFNSGVAARLRRLVELYGRLR